LENLCVLGPDDFLRRVFLGWIVYRRIPADKKKETHMVIMPNRRVQGKEKPTMHQKPLMKPTPHWLLPIIICFLLLVAIPQSHGADPSTGPIPDGKTVGLVMKTLTNPFFIAMETGARRAEKELGIRLLVKTGAKETSIDQQIAIVEDMIREHVDAIVIAPGSSIQLIPVLRKAQKAGIRIVNIDNRLDPDLSKKLELNDVPFVSVDNAQGAYLAARHISQNADLPASAAILEGIRSAANAAQRKQGALKAFQEIPGIRIAAMETANWKIDEAATVTAAIFAAHPDVTLLFCANDMMALGAIEYLQKTGKTHVRVAGFDALNEAVNAIRAGKLQATVDQNADQQGYLGVRYAVDLIQGKQPPMETLIDVKLITRDNLP
jgi:ribose transport system substrate-binding protein